MIASETSVPDVLVLAGTIVGSVSAALGLVAGARAVFLRTIGRRRDLTQRLLRLGTGAQLSFFESVLGEAPAIRRSFELQRPDWRAPPRTDGSPCSLVTRRYSESIFVNSLCYVQTISDQDDTVVGYAITTRSSSFHPTLWFPTYHRSPFRARLATFRRRLIAALRSGPERSRRARVIDAIRFDRPIGRRRQGGTRVELGRTTFEHARPGSNPRIQSSRGNKYWSYAEAYWGGNPGYYQHVVFAASRVSGAARFPDGVENLGWSERPWRETEGPEWIEKARSSGVITTMAVIGMGFEVEDWPTFGPTVDGMRTLP